MRAEARPFEVLDEFPDPVLVVDQGGVVVYASQAAELCLRRTGKELVGVELASLLGAGGALALRQALATLVEREGTLYFPVNLGHPGEGGMPGPRLDLSVRRFRHDGRTCFFVAARPGGQSTADGRRIDERLLQVQKMEAVARLAGGIAHEFNNLLTTIIGAAELLSYRLGHEPELRMELQGIRTATDRAATLVRRLLTFARRQGGHPRVVDLRTVVRSADRILASALGEEVELSIITGDAPCTAKVDIGQVEQVLLNLAINARDAMDEGGRLTVSVERVTLPAGADAPAGDSVRLQVSDTGSGMSREIIERIFEPFFTTKAREYGSGLGLAIVYGIVRQSGGHISVKSDLGAGSSFTILLPYVEPGVDDAASAIDEPIDENDVPRGTETILVVEDDEMVRGITVRALRALGYRILLAEDGEDALRTVTGHSGHIDVLLTDVAMPRMGGIELAERLIKVNPSLKVLFVSGYAEDELPGKVMLAKNHAFLDKPFTASTLARKLREMLDG
jgi:two-component system, cell cycle sensor histidine kinase and response regulator CckA